MFKVDDIANEKNKDHNKKWPYIPDHPNRMLIIGGSGSGKSNVLLNLIGQQDVLIKFICMQKIWVNQSINFSFKNMKIQKLSI